MDLDRATIKAQNKLREAEAHLEQVKAAEYCCDHNRNQALGHAKKQVKRWKGWISDRKVLDAEK